MEVDISQFAKSVETKVPFFFDLLLLTARESVVEVKQWPTHCPAGLVATQWTTTSICQCC